MAQVGDRTLIAAEGIGLAPVGPGSPPSPTGVCTALAGAPDDPALAVRRLRPGGSLLLRARLPGAGLGGAGPSLLGLLHQGGERSRWWVRDHHRATRPLHPALEHPDHGDPAGLSVRGGCPAAWVTSRTEPGLAGERGDRADAGGGIPAPPARAGVRVLRPGDRMGRVGAGGRRRRTSPASTTATRASATYWRNWLSAWSDLQFEIQDVVDAGDDVVLLIRNQRQWGRQQRHRGRAALPTGWCSRFAAARSSDGASFPTSNRPSKPPGCRSRRCRRRTWRSSGGGWKPWSIARTPPTSDDLSFLDERDRLRGQHPSRPRRRDLPRARGVPRRRGLGRSSRGRTSKAPRSSGYGTPEMTVRELSPGSRVRGKGSGIEVGAPLCVPVDVPGGQGDLSASPICDPGRMPSKPPGCRSRRCWRRESSC